LAVHDDLVMLASSLLRTDQSSSSAPSLHARWCRAGGRTEKSSPGWRVREAAGSRAGERPC
jgi:hypothetical protein